MFTHLPQFIILVHYLLFHSLSLSREFLGYSALADDNGSSSTRAGPSKDELTDAFKEFNDKYRSKSLLDQHQQGGGSRSNKKKSKEEELAPNFTWDRDRDLVGGRQASLDKVKVR